MTGLNVHYATAYGKTHAGMPVRFAGCSGNRPGRLAEIGRSYSRRQRSNAFRFIYYLDTLSISRAGGKSAFTCAEPQVIIEVLLRGVDPWKVFVKNIKIKGGESRPPCSALCRNYLSNKQFKTVWSRSDEDWAVVPRKLPEGTYWLDWDVVLEAR